MPVNSPGLDLNSRSPSFWGQALHNALVKTFGRTAAHKISRRILLWLRAQWTRRQQPAVIFRSGPIRLKLPLQHNFPFHYLDLPFYDRALPALAAELFKKYPDLKMIDVGANVGDTAAIVKASADIPVLCIEGNPEFLTYLQENVRSFSAVLIEPSLVGLGNNAVGELIETAGTSRIDPHVTDGVTLTFQTLDEILRRHSQFATAKLLKIDTDGSDADVIASACNYIQDARPIIYFEYDPVLTLQRGHGSGFHVFSQLASAGYQDAIFYDNRGHYMLRTNLKENELLKDLHQYVLNAQPSIYWDVAVFPEAEAEVCDTFHRAEILRCSAA